MIAGFTGSRNGMNEYQCKELERLFIKYKITKLRHGCSIGGDVHAHKIARKIGNIWIIGHPPVQIRYKSTLCEKDCDLIMFPKPYLDRNRDIVNKCKILFVGPDGPEKIRSGTWSTKRYAKNIGRKFIILPLEK